MSDSKLVPPRRRSSFETFPPTEAEAEPAEARTTDTLPVVETRAAAEPSRDPDGPWLLACAAETAPLRDDPSTEGERGPKPVTRAITAIAVVRARVIDGGDAFEVLECRAGGPAEADERSLLVGFWRSFENWKPRLVTFNGRGHLFPVLRYASMRHHLSARWLHEAGDRWNGYGTRFSDRFHVDLMDLLADQHASPYPSLSETALAIGVPPVDDTLAPRPRAENTAAVLFLAFVRFQLYSGRMSRAGHDRSVASLLAVLSARGAENPSLAILAAALA